MIKPNRPAPESSALVSGAAFPVDVEEVPLAVEEPLAELVSSGTEPGSVAVAEPPVAVVSIIRDTENDYDWTYRMC